MFYQTLHQYICFGMKKQFSAGVGHYQSIVPIQGNIVKRHYNWSLKNQDSRIDQSEVRARLPSNSRTIHSVSSITNSDIYSSSNVIKSIQKYQRKSFVLAKDFAM